MELAAERAARAAHGFHMNVVRWGFCRLCTECGSAGKARRRATHFWTVNTPAITPHTLVRNGADSRAHPGRAGWTGVRVMLRNLRNREGVNV